jgi:signal transduction histidine kinase
MSSVEHQERKTLHRRAAARTVALYALFSCLWIYFSDTVLAWFVSSPDQLTRAQTIKGGLFVLVTAALLYLYLGHCLRMLRAREEALEEQAEQSRRDVQDRFARLNTLFDSMNAIVYVADLENSQLLYVNRFAEQIFGPGWQGRKCYHYLQEGIDHPCDFCTNPQLLGNGKDDSSITWEFLNTRNNRWYECFDQAIRWPDGRLVRLEVAVDITERKELEKIKNDLLSSVNHEMRTPLTAISGFAELLKNEQEIPEQHRHNIGIIFSEAEKLNELVNNFLDVRRLKIDRARVDYQHLRVQDLLEKARKDCRDCRGHHKIEIDCRPDVLVYGNRQELTQVITQLLANACRYSPKGGRIALTARNNGNQATICIADQGIGIPQHELEAIFKPFHKLDTGDRRTTGGIGLGLSLAREIILLHGGRIEVESTPGQGSRFSIVLPLPGDMTPFAPQRPPGGGLS